MSGRRGSKKFLFVNKDSSSSNLTRSDKEEHTHILSHVRRRRSKPAEPAARKDEPWQKYTSCLRIGNDDGDGDDDDTNNTSEDDVFSVPPDSGAIASALTAATAGTTHQPHRSHDHLVRLLPAALRAEAAHIQSVYLPRIYPASNHADPFHSTVAGPLSPLHPMLYHGVVGLARKAFLSNTLAPESAARRPDLRIRHEAALVGRLRNCVDNPLLMYATLAYSASSLTWIGKRESSTDDATPDFPYYRGHSPEFFMGKALPVLRAWLASGNDDGGNDDGGNDDGGNDDGGNDGGGGGGGGGASLLSDPWLMASVYSLAISELWMGMAVPMRQRGASTSAALSRHVEAAYRASCRTHMRALLALVERAGGVARIDPYVADLLIFGDRYLALVEATPPMVRLDWDPGPEPAGPWRAEEDGNAARAIFPHLGEAFTVSTTALLPEALTAIVHDIIPFCGIAHHLWNTRRPGPDADEEAYLLCRASALIARLLAMPALRGKAECARLASLVFMLHATNYHRGLLGSTFVLRAGRVAIGEALLDDSDDGLEGGPQSGSDGVDDDAPLMFWCTCLMAMGAARTPLCDWFLDRTAEFARRAGVSPTEDAFRDALGGWLFLPDRQTALLRPVVREVAARWDEGEEDG